MAQRYTRTTMNVETPKALTNFTTSAVTVPVYGTATHPLLHADALLAAMGVASSPDHRAPILYNTPLAHRRIVSVAGGAHHCALTVEGVRHIALALGTPSAGLMLQYVEGAFPGASRSGPVACSEARTVAPPAESTADALADLTAVVRDLARSVQSLTKAHSAAAPHDGSAV